MFALLFMPLENEAADRLLILVRLNRDSQACFRAAGDGVDDAELTAMFYQLARQRGSFADTLQHYLDPRLERVAVDEPNTRRRPAVQRWWQALRQRLSANEISYVLRLTERAEDEVLAAYESVLSSRLAPELAQTLKQQRDEVVRAGERIHTLREAWSLRRAS
ncbi:PA2169 family four-helix-bundle protein [Phycisphaerales bacterium AB-hyl4]|uniref:PA2169 family four-helix-bundle protein n=1 Tax=Natronomicrosphaera hydrolytica TaxID=3242702 RepID=A0ABV4U7T7_9BACT